MSKNMGFTGVTSNFYGILATLFTVNKCLKVNYLSFIEWSTTKLPMVKNTNSHNDMKMTQV